MDGLDKHLEELQKGLQKVPGQSSLSDYSKTKSLQQTLTLEENRMINLKYKGKQICKMDDDELNSWTMGLLAKIHIITGWVIPNSPELLNVLIDQLQKRLQENCGYLNFDEIEYAFRQHGTTINDWGKEVNLNLIDKVVLNYISKRYEVSKMEEKITYSPEQKIFTQEELDNSAREDAERQYQIFLSGGELKGLSINKSILDQDELLLPDESVIDFFTRRARLGSLNIYKKETK